MVLNNSCTDPLRPLAYFFHLWIAFKDLISRKWIISLNQSKRGLPTLRICYLHCFCAYRLLTTEGLP